MRQRGLEATSASLRLKFLACESGLGDRAVQRSPSLVRSGPMHDDLARLGVRGRHLLTPFLAGCIRAWPSCDRDWQIPMLRRVFE